MCLLVVKPPGVVIPDDVIHKACVVNPDGMGIAWHDGDKVNVVKGFFRPDDFIHLITKVRKFSAIVHWRFATHGGISRENLHPFWISDGALGHNGIISSLDEKSGRSDTAVFVEDVLVANGLDYKGIRRNLERLEDMIGHNRIATIHENGRTIVWNRHLWTKHGGALYSNTSAFRQAPLFWRKA